ncbi:hypothetical protein Q9K02_04560 [Qipengyuania sp. G39]|uniref:Uncharacterized protein n=1 Tax=Qipengyuania profundimaris TaxID=3067652 RepID=A0ABT9HMM9_9SPHN|nr:hypothetical protein [Qipengyuania sp. G39]MDP4574409.1 hypothetical protein [Qipengyuania sp. G39]
MASSVKGFAGAARIRQLKTRADLRAAERHGMRLDKSGKERSIRDAKALTRSGLDVVDLYDKHVEGLLVQKNTTLAMHILIQFPKVLVDEYDPDLMLDHAISFCRDVFGENSVFADRIDRDEKNQHVVDVFVAPTYVKVTKHTSRPATSSTRHLRALAEKHGEPTVPHGYGRALQTEFFEYLRDTMKLEGVRRGEKKVRPGPDHKLAEEQRIDELKDLKLGLKKETSKAREERSENLEREMDLDSREGELKRREAQLDDQALQQQNVVRELAEERRQLDRARDDLAANYKKAQQRHRTQESKADQLETRDAALLAREVEAEQRDAARREEENLLEERRLEVEKREKFAEAFEAGIHNIVTGELFYAEKPDGSFGLRTKSGRGSELAKLIAPALRKVREIARTISEHVTKQVEVKVSEEKGILESLQKAFKEAIERNRLFAESFRTAMATLDRDARKRALAEKAVREAAEATQAAETADAIEPNAGLSLAELEYLRRQQGRGR